MLEREKFAFFGFLIRFELHEAEEEEEGRKRNERGTCAGVGPEYIVPLRIPRFSIFYMRLEHYLIILRGHSNSENLL
jgi:hypothetical protein